MAKGHPPVTGGWEGALQQRICLRGCVRCQHAHRQGHPQCIRGELCLFVYPGARLQPPIGLSLLLCDCPVSVLPFRLLLSGAWCSICGPHLTLPLIGCLWPACSHCSPGGSLWVEWVSWLHGSCSGLLDGIMEMYGMILDLI